MSEPPATDVSHDEAVRGFRRQRILEAARAAFSEKGLEDTSLRSIAGAAGCTTGAIYSQFSGKEELYARVLASSLTSLLAVVETGADRAEDPAGRLRGAVDAFFDYYRERPSELALGLYLFGGVRPRGLGRELDAELNGRLRDVLDVFSRAMADVAPAADVELETASLFTHLMGLLIVDQTRRVRVTNRDSEDLLAHCRESLLARLEAGRH